MREEWVVTGCKINSYILLHYYANKDAHKSDKQELTRETHLLFWKTGTYLL